jgi:hypothetical protein
MTPWGLVNCKVFGPQGPSLTNRMSELLTYGSVGGGGGNLAPYPAADVVDASCLFLRHRPRGSGAAFGMKHVWNSPVER